MARKKSNPFVAIPKSMLTSYAWLELGHPARVAYLHLKYKFNGKNAEDLSLTYNEMEPLMSRKTFSKAMKQLLGCGFVKLVRKGGLMRNPNIYALSDDWGFYRPKTDRKFN